MKKVIILLLIATISILVLFQIMVLFESLSILLEKFGAGIGASFSFVGVIMIVLIALLYILKKSRL